MSMTGSGGGTSDLVSTQKTGVQSLSFLTQVMQRLGPGSFNTPSGGTATISPNAYAYSLGTASSAIIGSNQGRVGLIFHNPNATGLVAVCPTLNSVNNPATALSAVVNGAGSYTILPYAELRIIGARTTCSWNAVANFTAAPLTIWEFV
jgi:hypothetical protein